MIESMESDKSLAKEGQVDKRWGGWVHPGEDRQAVACGGHPRASAVRLDRYGHIGQSAQRQAVNALNEAGFQGDGAQNWAQSQKARVKQLAN